MKKNLTEIVFILDKSGSMEGLEKDTIGGYNSMLKKQKAEEGEATITTVLFDDDYEILHDRINIKNVRFLTDEEYSVGGCTAMLDAVGKTINKISKVQKNTMEEGRAEKVLFIITTDGLENSSVEYSYSDIKKMISRQKEKYGWEFIFLGANIDAVKEADKFGISNDNAVNYKNDSEGTSLNYEVLSEAISELRAKKCMSKKWKSKIEDDFKKRG